MSADEHYDAVIVGAGVCGSIAAKYLTRVGLRVLVLEAGPASAVTYDGYVKHLEHFYEAPAKVPEAPWPPAANAPQPDVLDLGRNPAQDTGYFVQEGPVSFRSTYDRLQGGTTMHWLGTCLRMLPEDFEMRSRYGVGCDWPLSYEDLSDDYARAEREIGVSADVDDQAYLGMTFSGEFPMHRIPRSYSDRTLAAAVDGMDVTVGGETIRLKVRSTPAGRNSIPREGYEVVGAVDEQREGQALARDLGQRCAGNSACIPICPIQAKYNAGKTLAQADKRHLRVLAQAVASRVEVDETGAVTGIQYQRYEDPDSPRHTVHTARGRVYMLAAHTVENAKLMLASGLRDPQRLIGANLMDHPTMVAWARCPPPSAPTAARCRPRASRTFAAARSVAATPRSAWRSATTAGTGRPARPTPPSPRRSTPTGCSARRCASTSPRRCPALPVRHAARSAPLEGQHRRHRPAPGRPAR